MASAETMSRRVFIAGATTTGAAVTAAAQDDDAEGDEETEETDGGTEEVIVGPGGNNVFEPEELTIQPGTTVVWTWESDNHNVNPTEQPDDADWEGHEPIENTGFEYEFTFEVEGEYHYVCDPHIAQGMEGDIIVGEEPDNGEAAPAADVDIHELGIPIQKHFVGVATFLAIFVSLVFTFYLLKYGESTHSQSPGRKR